MRGVFESGESTVPRVRVPLLPVVRRVLLAWFAWRAAGASWSIATAIDALAWWGAGHPFPFGPAVSLLLRLVGVLAAGSTLVILARIVRERPRVTRGAVAARVDAEGLHAGDRRIVAHSDVADVHVATDADLGFALVVTTRGGATVRIMQRSESSARGLAAALGAKPGALVFEGVSGGRSRETRAAALAATAVVGAFVLTMLFHWMSDNPAAWRWFDGWRAEIPFTFAWWLGIVCAFQSFPAGIAFAAALGAIVKRARTGSVAVGPTGVMLADGKIAPEAITGVEPGTASDVTLALRDGRHVRLAFGAERALVERDLFVARVRALVAGPAGEVETYSAAETSGVRVASDANDDSVLAEDEADVDLQAPRTRRR